MIRAPNKSSHSEQLLSKSLKLSDQMPSGSAKILARNTEGIFISHFHFANEQSLTH